MAPKTEGRRVLDTTMYEDELPEEEELVGGYCWDHIGCHHSDRNHTIPAYA